MGVEAHEAKREARGEMILEGASELEDYGYCPDCNKVDKVDIYKEVLDKIDAMVKHKKEIQQRYLNDEERDDRYLRYSMLQEQIRALKELREVLW